MKVKIGPATVAVERGDISLIDADAVVNAANTTLAMGTGVAGALKKRGGVVIEEEAMRLGPVEIGEACRRPTSSTLP
jgi:O-acetyl-ADP-ribose deacetylase